MATQQIKKPRAADRPLAPYRAKRDFKATEEPEGAGKPEVLPSSELPFVVQKHAATRLHYDFRLGWRGVLKSWAVTRGPSYYPGDKRLAVQVEDHPMEYKDFEGTIPKGQYGGGTVMVWDRGTWEPHGDVDRGLEEGHLKFALHGTRLKGDWVLVRMKDRPGDRKSNWLLIKEHDRFERPSDSKPITETAAISAVTKRFLDQIAKAANNGNGSAPEQSPVKTKVNRRKVPPAKIKAILEQAPREKLPAFIAPQLAQTAMHPPEGDDWVHELKFDGYRIQIHIDAGTTESERQVRLLTRNRLDWTSRMPLIAAAAAQLPVTTAILDGEVVVLNDKGVADFADLQAAFQEGKKKPLTYIAFDLLHLDGHNLRGLPFLDRKALLADLLKRNGDSVLHFTEHLEAHGKETFAAACRLGAEGIVSKLASAKYTSGRGSAWLKAKCIQEQEFIIGGFTPVAKSGQGIGALLLGYNHGGELRYAGRTGTGFSQSTQKLLRRCLEKSIQKGPPFAEPPSGALRDVRWVRPELVAQVSFSNWTRDNLVRQAAFKGLREDKLAKEVIREATAAPVSPTSVAPSKPKPKSPRAKRSLDGAKMAGVTLTHPDKVLDETTGMTKQDLASYYAAVAEHMLPFIENRPLSIVRCPEGSSKPCFFQKHVGFGIPSSVKTVSIPNRKNGTKESYLTVDSAEGLVGLAQMGVLEIHSWGSKNDSLEKPDRIVIDLDPDESIDWKTLTASALEVRKQFKALGLDSFVKSTGGKGLHVVVPIRADHAWPVVKDFAHALVTRMEKANPDLYVTKMTKALRKNHIYLDYLRNDREATAIAPFSPRARAGAPVAVPLSWTELKSAVMPVFRVTEFAKWRKRLNRNPWAGMDSLQQSLPAEPLRGRAAQRRT
jgi:bifunctional non-homologous end joining protein LigD